MQSLGQSIRSWRGERGLTLRALAARAQCTPGYLSQIETGKTGRPPSSALLSRLETSLALTPGTLVEQAAMAQLSPGVRAELGDLRAARGEALRLAALVAQLAREEQKDGEMAEAVSLASRLVAMSGGCAQLVAVVNQGGELPRRAALSKTGSAEVPRGWVSVGETGVGAFAVRVVDGSMEPLLRAGDVVVFEGVLELRVGSWGLAAVAGQAELLLGYLSPGRGAGWWRLGPANPCFAGLDVEASAIEAMYQPIAVVRRLARAGQADQGKASGWGLPA